MIIQQVQAGTSFFTLTWNIFGKVSIAPVEVLLKLYHLSSYLQLDACLWIYRLALLGLWHRGRVLKASA